MTTLITARWRSLLVLAITASVASMPAWAKAFLDFVRSKEGTKILRTNGYLPGE